MYYKLSDVTTLNKNKDDAKIIHETLKEQTFAVYIKWIIGPIRTIVKSQNPLTLEQAKQIARSEKIEFNSDREAINNLNKNRNFKNQNNYDKQNFNQNLSFQRNNND